MSTKFKSIMAAGSCLMAVSVWAIPGATFDVKKPSPLVSAEECSVSGVTWDAKKLDLGFSWCVPKAGTYRLKVLNLLPKNYIIHFGEWTIGKKTIEELAAGIDLELDAGTHAFSVNKHGWAIVSLQDVKVWGAMLKRVKSTLDGTLQPCYFKAPVKAQSEAVPLIVGLHTWSCDYHQLDHYRTVLREAEKRGWAFVGPNFRGPNETPAACGSDYAVQDIVDAVNYAKAQCKIDEKRVYIIGGSGGGHMTLLMLGRHPEVFAGGAAFCPITDLARWHADSLLEHPGRGKGYARMLEGACGGTPAQKSAEYAHRSPLTWLKRAKEAHVPAYIVTGIHDGWTGSVPVGHSFRAFNALCEAGDEVSESDIAQIEATQKVPDALAYKGPKDTFYNDKMRIHFRRTSGDVRFTLFEGGHGGNFAAGFDFLSRQAKGKPTDWTIPASGKGREEHLSR